MRLNKRRLLVVVVLLGLIVLSGCFQQKFRKDFYVGPDIKGQGTKDDPFIIYTFAGLEKVGTKGYPLDSYYKLGRDIDAGITREQSYNNGKGWKPIGQVYDLKNKNWNPLEGVFDGQGHKIKNLYINRDRYCVGFFGIVNEGEIKNLQLEKVEIKGRNYVGGLVGFNYKGTIKDSSVTGKVEGKKGVGGLVGNNEELIKDSHTKASVEGEISSGGLAGFNSGIIKTSYARGSIKGDEYIGGLVGVNQGLVKRSFAAGDAAGEENIGGLIGANYKEVKNCYSTSDIRARDNVGGIVGYNLRLIDRTYAVGRIQCSAYSGSGGIVGENRGEVRSSYWKIGMSKRHTPGSDVGLLALKQESTFRAWDYEKDWDFEEVWAIDEGESYPYLRANNLKDESKPQPEEEGDTAAEEDYVGPDIEGKGTKEDPFIIYTFSGLEKIGTDGYPLDAYYKLGRDIDAGKTGKEDYNSGRGWDPIGKIEQIRKRGFIGEIKGGRWKAFSGVFDGQGYKIKNLSIYRVESSFVGLFSVVEEGIIKNLGLTEVNIKGDTDIGGLAAYNLGVIKNCYVEGQLESNGPVGGLSSYNEGTIIKSYSRADLRSLSDVGGLVSINSGEIAKSYAAGDVEGNIYIGGLVSRNKGKIRNSHAVGNVKGNLYIGGLVGINKSLIKRSYAAGKIEGYDRETGGLVGDNKEGTIASCYAKSDIVGVDCVGGLAGGNSGIIKDSYAGGSTEGISDVGGLVGYNSNLIKNSYARAEVSGRGTSGGLVGSTNEEDGEVINSYWSKEISTQEESDGGINKSTVELKEQSTFKDWDFNDIWVVDDSYPYLKWEK